MGRRKGVPNHYTPRSARKTDTWFMNGRFAEVVAKLEACAGEIEERLQIEHGCDACPVVSECQRIWNRKSTTEILKKLDDLKRKRDQLLEIAQGG